MELNSKFERDSFNLSSNRKQNTTSYSSQSNENSTVLEQKLNDLEHQYVTMEAEYMKKIKQLKTTLMEKNRKQMSLTNQINQLREQFKHHQEEIVKVGREMEVQESREELKHSKKNSSPGLIKKSLEIDKKNDKKYSPNAHYSSKNYPMPNIIQTASIQPQPKSSPQVKKKSPQQGLFRALQRTPTATPINMFEKTQKQQKEISPKGIKPYVDKHSGEAKQKAYSPKSNNGLQALLMPSVKNLQQSKVDAVIIKNPSPKRFLRRSPGQNEGSLKIQPKKEGKQLLGKLKETMEEVF